MEGVHELRNSGGFFTIKQKFPKRSGISFQIIPFLKNPGKILPEF